MLEKLKNPDLGLLLIRLALATIFLVASVAKFLNLATTTAFFGKIGLAPFFVYLVASVEMLGGLAMLFGVATAGAGILLAIVMIFAITLAKWPLGFLAWELDFTLLLAALGVALAGPGRYSLRWPMKPEASM